MREFLIFTLPLSTPSRVEESICKHSFARKIDSLGMHRRYSYRLHQAAYSDGRKHGKRLTVWNDRDGPSHYDLAS